MSKVDYKVFWGQVKLVGYTMQLRPEHIRSIDKSIGLDYEKDILDYHPNYKKALICDENFGYKDGFHEPQKLLMIGFMYCYFRNEMDHMENLWHLINPNFKSRVSLRVINSTLEDLLYIAIDQRLGMVAEDETCDPLQATFLETVKAAKQSFIDLTLDELKEGDPNCNDITRGKFDRVFIPAFCRPSNLR